MKLEVGEAVTMLRCLASSYDPINHWEVVDADGEVLAAGIDCSAEAIWHQCPDRVTADEVRCAFHGSNGLTKGSLLDMVKDRMGLLQQDPPEAAELEALRELDRCANRVLWVKPDGRFSIADVLASDRMVTVMQGPDSRSTDRDDWNDFGQAIMAVRHARKES